MNYNPYNLIQLLINGKPIGGRPYEMDSDVVNQKTMENGFGNLVKPSKVITMCPDCSQGLQVDVKLGDPPFEPVVYTCPYCKPAPPSVIDPFINPVKTGRVPAASLDPILHDPGELLPTVGGTVMDRFKIPEPSVESAVPTPPAKPPRPQNSRKGKKADQAAPTKTVSPVPPAEVTKVRPAMVEQVIEPRSPEEINSANDPFTLTPTTQDRSVVVEKVDGLGEEHDFDDKDMVD